MGDFEDALTAHRVGDLDTAERGYRQAIAAGEHEGALGNLGLVLWRRGLIDEAETALRRAVVMRPDNPGLRYNLGRFLWLTGRLVDAELELRSALRLDPMFPGARVDLGNVLLAAGKTPEGWEMYESRPERLASACRALPFPEWRGEPLAGKRLFIGTEQGFGDQIFAARFIKAVTAEGITVCTQRPLARLFSQLPANILPRDLGTAVRVDTHDYWCMPLSLPRWVAPPAGPYLGGSPRGAGGIGITWQGNALPDPGRSLPDELGARLMTLDGAVCLHPAVSGATDFQDTADIIAGLDLVVTIDTSVAHLAGAMGKPTLLLLQHFQSDWRWTLPWYPSIELIRQPSPGDWLSVVSAVEERLTSGE